MNPIFAADLLYQPGLHQAAEKPALSKGASPGLSVRGSGFSNPRKRSLKKTRALALVYVFLIAWLNGKRSFLLNYA